MRSLLAITVVVALSAYCAPALHAQSVDVASGGGIEVAGGGGIVVAKDFEATGDVILDGDLTVGGDLRMENASTVAEVHFEGAWTHHIDLPDDAEVGELTYEGDVSGDLDVLLTAYSVNGRVNLPDGTPELQRDGRTSVVLSAVPAAAPSFVLIPNPASVADAGDRVHSPSLSDAEWAVYRGRLGRGPPAIA